MQDNLDANVIYGDMTARMDTIVSFTADQIQIWRCIQRANTDWKISERNHDHPNNSVWHTEKFIKWLAETWGIKLTTDNGNYTTNFDIISADKYTMFVLKYSK
jgi:hypothetical protein